MQTTLYAGTEKDSSVRHADQALQTSARRERGQLSLRCRPRCTQELERTALFAMQTKLFRLRHQVKEDNSVRDADQTVRQKLERTALFTMQTKLYSGSGENSSVRHADQAVLRNWRGQLCSPCRPSCTQELERTALFAMHTALSL